MRESRGSRSDQKLVAEQISQAAAVAARAEVEASGYELPGWVRAASLLRLVLREMETATIARPELRSYEQRLAWVRAQLGHHRANLQAQALEETKNDDAMVIGTLEVDGAGSEDTLIARLTALEAVVRRARAKEAATPALPGRR